MSNNWEIGSSQPTAYSAGYLYLIPCNFEQIMEQTYVMIKPDGVQRGLVGQIISKFEAKAQWNITMP